MEKVTLRIPDDLHARYVQHAERNNRSLNAQIVEAMERDIDGPRAEQPREQRGRKEFKTDFKDPPVEKKGRR